MYSKITLIVNPASGTGSSLKLHKNIKSNLNSKIFDIKTYITTKKQDFTKIINENLWDDTLVLIFGGDGSFNFVINEIVKNNIAVKLLPIPCGTSNVYNFATTVDINRITQKINTHSIQSNRFKVGEVEYGNGNLCYFFSMAGIGFDAHIVEKLHSARKERLFIWSYLTQSIEEVFLKNYKPNKFKIFSDTKILDNVFFAISFNINAYGGPFKFFRCCDPDPQHSNRGKYQIYNENFINLIYFQKHGIGSIPSIYTGAFLNHFLSSISSLTKQKISYTGKDFPSMEILEIFVEPENYESKIPLHVDGDPLTYLPVVIRKSTKAITIYS